MRIMGRPRVLFAVLASCLVLAGCGSGPSQVGAAVIVDGQVISVDEVQGLIDKALQDQPLARQMAQQHKLDLVGREVVQQLLIHDTLAKVAKREGIVANNDAIAQALQQDPLAEPLPVDGSVPPEQAAKQIVIRARDHREAITDVFLEQQLAAKYFARLSVTFDFSAISADSVGGTSTTVRDKAIQTAKQYAGNLNAATELIKQAAQAGGQASTGQTIPAVQSPPDAATILFGVPANTVVAFQPDPSQATWVVVIVRDRIIGAPAAVDQATQPTSDQLTAIGQRLLEPDLDAASLKINPRYGVWDKVAMNVAPSEAMTTGVVLPVRGAVQSQQ
jgi:hypothetical protein